MNQKVNQTLIDGLAALCSAEEGSVVSKSDQDGNAQYWFKLNQAESLPPAASLLKDAGARLTMISGYTNRQIASNPDGVHGICYHFEVTGSIVNLTVALSKEAPATISIASYFANAAWHEREMVELVGVKVNNLDTSERLFLDESLDAGILNDLVPLSVVMNGACSTDLWERLMSQKGGN